MPLDQASVIAASDHVYRITLSPRQHERRQRVRDAVGTGPEFQAALNFLNEEPRFLGPSILADLLRLPFEQPTRRPTRFSDGSHAVLYTAQEWETAGQEYGHWAPMLFGTGASRPFRVRLHLISCRFEGAAKDIRPYVTECPWLTANTYEDCQKLGAAAKAEGLDGLLAPSARSSGGTTVPILSQSSASQPREEGEVIYVIDPGALGGPRATFTR